MVRTKQTLYVVRCSLIHEGEDVDKRHHRVTVSAHAL